MGAVGGKGRTGGVGATGGTGGTGGTGAFSGPVLVDERVEAWRDAGCDGGAGKFSTTWLSVWLLGRKASSLLGWLYNMPGVPSDEGGGATILLCSAS